MTNVRSPLRLAVLGSTGSIGCQTLDVVRAHPDRFQVVGLAAGQNVSLLEKQIEEFRPGMTFSTAPELLYRRLQAGRGPLPQLVSLEAMASDPEVDVIVSAVVGKGGLAPTLAALAAGKVVALANKEPMVMAGALVSATASEHAAEIRPVDSEHSAIWQCLAGEKPDHVRKIIITASGGALRDLPPEALERVTPEEALAHPNWSMGKRITIDSASLFNKGLEVIEARWLFDVPFERIEVLMHRESIIHSMVELVDGSLKAHLSFPDMRLPIQYALSFPERVELNLPPVDFATLGALHFGPLDLERYPCLALALAAGRQGGTYPAALAAADEEAVALFLDGRLGFLDIPRLLADTLDRHNFVLDPGLEEIMAADDWGRRFAREWGKSRR